MKDYMQFMGLKKVNAVIETTARLDACSDIRNAVSFIVLKLDRIQRS